MEPLLTAQATVPLGVLLTTEGTLTRPQLRDALATQQAHGSRLGDVLVSQGLVSPLDLHAALARQHQLPHARLDTAPVDATLLRHALLHEYISRQAVPWRMENGALILAACAPSDALRAWAEQAYGLPCRLAVATPLDIRRAIETHFSHVLTRDSRLQLHRMAPLQSARRTFIREQRLSFAALGCLAFTAACLAPLTALAWTATVLHVLYATTMLFKLLVYRAGLEARPLPRAPIPPSRELPVYTILVPLYDEAASLPHLMASLKRLDYPPSKLDIKLLLERDDDSTWAAAQALKPGWNMEIIRVPPSRPRTKPKALNYGLRFARGEFVTIFDAEDEPEPDQLKKAVAAFRAAPEDVVCLQARLHYYNANDSWLTRMFALEYGVLFGTMLPGLQRLGIPIPLGGTSNHLALGRLRELGAWDPFNVTEDADLGVRLACRGLKTAMLASTTWEEAPARLGPWMRQRSRWVKGYMQTWLVHMREPWDLWRKTGTVSYFGLHYFVGMGPLTFLTAPIVWLAWLMPGLPFPAWFAPLAWLNLGLHLGVHWLQAYHALPECRGYRKHSWAFTLAALCYPLYWLLHSFAAYKALGQLIRRPHYWEKTAHGLAKRALTTHL